MWRNILITVAWLTVVSPFSRSLGSIFGLQTSTRYTISATTDDIGVNLQVADTDSVSFSSTNDVDNNNSSSNQSRASYTALLIHYLAQNAKPKFHICVSVLSKIVERDGCEKAVSICESLQHRISTENFKMAKNALLSALVVQRQTEAATSHLRRLLFQQTANWQLDLSVIADLLGLYMGAETNRETDTITLRRMYKKRALESSLLYNDLIEANKSRGNSLMGKGGDKEIERGYQSQLSSDRIHEYGARAYAASGDWRKAVTAIACISGRHLVSDGMISFSSKLINRLILEETKKSEKSPKIVSSKGSLGSFDSIDSSGEMTGENCSFATELALLQPLSLLPADSSILHSSLLQLSASPLYIDLVIESLREISKRSTDLELTRTVPFAEGQENKSHVLSGPMALPIIQRLFASGCKFELLVEAMLLLYGGSSNRKNSTLTWPDMIAIDEGDDSNIRLVSNIAEVYAADTVANVIDAACLLRDRKKLNTSFDQDSNDANQALNAQQFARRMVQIPMKVIRALSAGKATTGRTLAAAVNPSLCVLLLSLRKAGLQEEACATLQSIADMDNITPVWAPDPDLLSRVGQLIVECER